MSNLESLVNVEYHNNRYTIVGIRHANKNLPIVLDRHIYKIIKKLNKKWYINEKNHVYCLHNKNNDDYHLYLHDLVMRTDGNHKDDSIVHVNNIHFDNRLVNLQYDIPDKNYSKNAKKKKRTINLNNKDIDVSRLPTYIWYIKPDITHGDRFMVDIPNEISWKTTSSKRVSLLYKLEEAKKFLRHMTNERPDIFNNYSMNGDLTEYGYKLYREYDNIIKQAGFAMDIPANVNTDRYLIQDTQKLTDFEKYLLEQFDPNNGNLNINTLFRQYYKDGV